MPVRNNTTTCNCQLCLVLRVAPNSVGRQGEFVAYVYPLTARNVNNACYFPCLKLQIIRCVVFRVTIMGTETYAPSGDILDYHQGKGMK